MEIAIRIGITWCIGLMVWAFLIAIPAALSIQDDETYNVALVETAIDVLICVAVTIHLLGVF